MIPERFSLPLMNNLLCNRPVTIEFDIKYPTSFYHERVQSMYIDHLGAYYAFESPSDIASYFMSY